MIFLIDGNPTVSINQVLVVVAAAAVTVDDMAVPNLDVVNAYSGVATDRH